MIFTHRFLLDFFCGAKLPLFFDITVFFAQARSSTSRGGAPKERRGRDNSQRGGCTDTSYSVEINPASAALTLFNNKNGCPTSAGTGTLCCQRPMFHLLNPLKSVPPLGYFSLKISQHSSVVTQFFNNSLTVLRVWALIQKRSSLAGEAGLLGRRVEKLTGGLFVDCYSKTIEMVGR